MLQKRMDRYDEAGTQRRKAVRMGNAGALKTLADFQKAQSDSLTSRQEALRQGRALASIQRVWRGHRVRQRVGDAVVEAILSDASSLTSRLLNIQALSRLPLCCTWRRVHYNRNDRSEQLRQRNVIVRPSHQELMTLLLSQKGGVFDDRYLNYTVQTKDVLRWLTVKAPRSLPPMWTCVLFETLELVVSSGHVQDDSLLESFALMTEATVGSWIALSPTVAPCGCLKDHSAAMQRALHLVKELLRSRKTLHDALSLHRALQAPSLRKCISEALVEASPKNRIWDALSSLSDRLRLRMACLILADWGARVNREETSRALILRLPRLLTLEWAKKLKNPDYATKMYMTDKINMTLMILTVAKAQARRQAMAARWESSLEGAEEERLLLLELLSFSLSNVNVAAHRELEEAIESEALQYLFSFGNDENVDIMSRLSVIFTKSSIRKHLTAIQRLHIPEYSVYTERVIWQIILDQPMYETDEDDETSEGETSEVVWERNRFLGYTTPIDAGSFDKIVISTDILLHIYQKIGHIFFIECMGRLDLFIDKCGEAPGFASDVGLLIKSMVAMFTRRSILLDDLSMVEEDEIRNEPFDTTSAAKIWKGNTQRLFPMAKPQYKLFCSFINRLTLGLIIVLSRWSTETGLCLRALHLKQESGHGRTWNPGYIVYDLSHFSRSLYRRCRRLKFGLELWECPEATLRTTLGRLNVDETLGAISNMPSLARAALLPMIIIVISEVPQTIDFRGRLALFDNLLKEDRSRHGRTPDSHNIMQAPLLVIRRDRILEDSLPLLARQNLKEPFRVQFVDSGGDTEAGLDGGGLLREYLVHLARELFDPSGGLFRLADCNTLIPSPMAWNNRDRGQVRDREEHLCQFEAAQMFELAGVVCGKAVYEGVLLSAAHFSTLFINRVMGEVNTSDDLRVVDPELYKNIQFVKHYEGDVSNLGLTFSVTLSGEMGGLTGNVDLVPHGSNRPVTNENRHQYVLLLSHYLTNSAFDKATQYFQQGLRRIIDLNWLRLFDAQGFRHLISGGDRQGFNVADLKANTVYSGGYSIESPTIGMFWKVMEHSSPEFQSKFLEFVMANDRPPLQGFGVLRPKFCIGQQQDTNGLPTASTCTNLLRLPAYENEILMREKLARAIYEATGFHLA